MSGAPLSTTLRTGGAPLVLGEAPRIVFRVQSLDAWETLRVEAPASTTVSAVKDAALLRLEGKAAQVATFVVKHRGVEVTDESATLDAVGVRDGSILSVSRRRRRAVR